MVLVWCEHSNVILFSELRSKITGSQATLSRRTMSHCREDRSREVARCLYCHERETRKSQECERSKTLHRRERDEGHRD
jgi:hypothetical protein